MIWKRKVFQNFKLYAVTDLQTASAGIFSKIDQACRGGADIIQLRSKQLSDRAMIILADKIKAIVHSRRKLFFINDRVDLALAVNADGVHLGQEDLSVQMARKMSRALRQTPFFIGKSTHSFLQAQKALKESPDYFAVGPVFGTPTKPGYAPVGLNLIRKVSSIKPAIPFVCIGGINENNLGSVLNAGATRIAVVRAIFESKDSYVSTKNLRKKIENHPN